MSAASLDRLLAVLVLALAGTGLASLRAGQPSDAWVFVLHGVLAGVLAAAVVRKVEHSVPRAVGGRRWGRLALGTLVSLGAAAALSAGYLWVVSGQILWLDLPGIGRWTVLTLHAWVGLLLVPLVLLHVLPTRWRLLRPGRDAVARGGGRLRSRRAVLAAGVLGLAGIGAWIGAQLVDRVLGGERRFTGSRWLPAGRLPIPTTFFGEPAPAIDPAAWRLRVEGRVGRPLSLSLDGLRRLGDEELLAVLDCTSGWAIETAWRGAPLAAVLEAAGVSPGASRVEVRSLTGWATSLTLDDARRCLLAWSVAGEPLPVGNGAPLRLVAPDHRGLEWVKWVSEVRVS